MKILITTGIYPPDIGGPATYSRLLVEGLPQRGIEVKVLSFGEVRHLPKIIRHFIYFSKIFSKAKGVDVLYAQDPVSVGFPTALANVFLRKRFFIRIAGDYAWEQGVQRFDIQDDLDVFSLKNDYGWQIKFFKKIQIFVAKRADQIIVPSYYFKTVIVNWGINPDKIEVIYNGINLQDHLALREPNNEEKKIIMLSVGRLVPWKGFRVLVEIMPDLLKKISELKLMIVGSGPQQLELENLVKKLNLEKQVILTGQLSREELLELKNNVDIFILNTHWESFSFDVLEAMAVGLPIITTKVGSLPELIENNQEGILINPDDKEAIVNAVQKILQNDNFRQAIIQNAYQKSKQFSLQSTLDNLEKLLTNK